MARWVKSMGEWGVWARMGWTAVVVVVILMLFQGAADLGGMQ